MMMVGCFAHESLPYKFLSNAKEPQCLEGSRGARYREVGRSNPGSAMIFLFFPLYFLLVPSYVHHAVVHVIFC